MSPLVPLLRDLTLILLTAAVVTLLFRRLRLPLILGYLTAGLIVSPSSPIFQNVIQMEHLEIWAQIGVIFLLFSIGLEFSYQRLLRMGKGPLLTGVFEVTAVFLAGLALTTFLGLSKIEGIFLAAALCISSTSIVARSFHELRFKGRRFVAQAFGILLVEDGLAILLLIALATLATGESLDAWQILTVAGRFLFFIFLCFVAGVYLVPLALRRVRPWLSNETTVLISVGLCLLMVVLATYAGFSAAIGAFLMGSILAGTPEGPRIEQLLEPLKDLFVAIFFVSIGMLIDPHALVDDFAWVFTLAIFVVVAKFVFVTLGSVLSGQKMRTALQTGISLTQIGEFSFLIAKLGMQTKATSDRFFPVVVLISVITSFTTPVFLKFSDPFAGWLEGKLPERWHHRLETYHHHMADKPRAANLRLAWRAYGWQILTNSVVLVGLTLLVRGILWNFLEKWWPFSEASLRHLAATTVIMLGLPFFWALVLGRPARSLLREPQELQKLRGITLGLTTLRAVWAAGLLVFMVGEFLNMRSSLWMLMGLFVGLYALRSGVSKTYARIEEKFLDHLNEKERAELERANHPMELAPWDAELAEVEVSADSPLIGQTYLQAGLRDKFGVMVALIQRGSRKILAPTRDETVYPGDRLSLIGTEDQVQAARSALEPPAEPHNPGLPDDFGLDFFIIEPNSEFAGKNIRDSGLREKVDGFVVGLEREGRRFLNPDSGLTLEPWDLLWIVGSRNKVLRGKKDRRPS